VQQAPFKYPYKSVGFLSVEYADDQQGMRIYRHASGFLIRDNFILTAAHTFVSQHQDQHLLGARFHLWGQEGSCELTDWAFHPDYPRPPTLIPSCFAYDLVVAKLNRRLNEYPLALEALDDGDGLGRTRLTCAGYTDAHSGVWRAKPTIDGWPAQDYDRNWPIFLPNGTTVPTTSGGPVMRKRTDGYPVVVGLIQSNTTFRNNTRNTSFTVDLAVPIRVNPTENFIRNFIGNNS